MKRLPKILITIFLSIFTLQMVCLILLLTIPEKTQAADVKFTPQVTIPGADSKPAFEKGVATAPSIAKYIKAIYNYAIGIVGILAAVVLMFGGVIWLTAGGNQEKVKEAKAWIGASLSGLVLVLCSYMILNTINPDLVSFKEIEPEIVLKKEDYSGKAFDEKGNPKLFCCQGQIDVNNGHDEFACAPYQYANDVQIGEKEQWIMSKEVCENFAPFSERVNTAYLVAKSNLTLISSIRQTLITVVEITSETGGCDTETGKCIKQ